MAKDYQRKPSSTAVVVAEYRLLNALVMNTDYLSDSRVTKEIFVDEVAKSIFEAIYDLAERGVDITRASLLQAGTEIDFNVNEAVVNRVFDVDEEGASTLEDILPSLRNAHLKYELTAKLSKLKELINENGTLDVDKVLSGIYDLDDTLHENTKDTSKLVSFDGWSDEYIEELKSRKEGLSYSYGDPLMNKTFFKGAYPGAITTIAGSPAMGKSTVALNFTNGLLEENVPVLYVSLEMSATDQYDRLLSNRTGIDSSELYIPENIDSLIEEVEEEKSKLSNRKYFKFCEEPNLSISSLRSLIKEFKKTTRQDYVVVIVDLLTQLKDFMSATNNTTTASSGEIAMNELNALAKAENCHIIGVVQFRRASDSFKVNCLEDINKLRPTLTDIKNSGAIAERSRVVLSVFRSKYYAEKYFNKDNEDLMQQLDAMDDILDIQVLKNSSGQSGQILKYIYDASHFRILPVLNEDEFDELASTVKPRKKTPQELAIEKLSSMGIGDSF